MTLNKFFPKVVKAVLPFAPVVGVVSTCLLVASAVAQVADPILNAGMGLQVRSNGRGEATAHPLILRTLAHCVFGHSVVLSSPNSSPRADPSFARDYFPSSSFPFRECISPKK